MKDSAENVVLVGLYLDTQALAAIQVEDTWRSAEALERVQGAREHLTHVGLRLQFHRWLGRPPTPSERRALARALERLEGRGYVVRFGGRHRTTHARLTTSGREHARAVLKTPDDELFLRISVDDFADPIDSGEER